MTKIKTYKGQITILKHNEVFVFGCNKQGFHGAGAAGYATFGETGNVWRKHRYNTWPLGTQGMWNRKGKIGFQEGKEGKSYGLVTVERAGAKNSLLYKEWIQNIQDLYDFCNKKPEWTFYLAQTAKMGLNGVNPLGIAKFFVTVGEIPANLVFEESFGILVKHWINKNE
jgi:hypothetical protein